MADWILFNGRWSNIPFGRSFEGKCLAEWDAHSVREEQETFCGQKLNKPGTQVDIEGKLYLIGDINKIGGLCDDCLAFEPDKFVTRYRVLLLEEGQ